MTALPSSAPSAARMPPTMPHFTLQRTKYTSTMKIGCWTIVAMKKPILNGREIEAAEKSLNLPLPEMTFGNNSLCLSYDPSSSSSRSNAPSTWTPSRTQLPGTAQTGSNGPSSIGEKAQAEGTSTGKEKVEISFHTLEALAGVATGEGWEERVGGGVKVAMAEHWGKNRSTPSALLSDTPLPSKPVKPHDWTYSTCYAGSVAGPSTFTPSPTSEIPMKLLARQDPILDQILYYDDVSLFEDELHDNGESILNVRIRVMPHSFFILMRLFLRVDNVLFRVHDVRIYHAFESGEVIREVSGMEADYEEIRSRLDKPSDLSPLTDPNFVYSVMSSMNDPTTRPPLPHRSSSASQRGKPWPGLGKRIEVLRLPGSVDGATGGFGQLRI